MEVIVWAFIAWSFNGRLNKKRFRGDWFVGKFKPRSVTITRQLESCVCWIHVQSRVCSFIFVKSRFIFRPAVLISMETSGKLVLMRVLLGNRCENYGKGIFVIVDNIVLWSITIIICCNNCNLSVISDWRFIGRLTSVLIIVLFNY